jgi:hypothetical protein
MKNLKRVKNFNKIDDRNIGQVVLCKKTLRNKFLKGLYYEVSGFYGDPESAHRMGLQYLPVEFINIVCVLDKNKNIQKFSINLNSEYFQEDKHRDFFEYFEILDFSSTSVKYNI